MNLKLLKSTCQLTQNQLLEILPQYLNKYYKNIVVTKDYIIAEGLLPVALVAHLDTVGLAPPHDIYYDQEQTVMWSPQLLGADDRAGIFSIVNIIEAGYRPHIIFTCDEEKGCVGALALTQAYPKRSPWKSLKAIIQLDRRGQKDSVFYDCDNKEFEKFINRYDFETAMGTFSDISVIAPSWGVAAVNLSCGYLNEHTIGETLNITWMGETIEKTKKILEDIDSYKKFKYIQAEGSYPIFFMRNGFCPLCNNKLTKKNKVHTVDNMDICKKCYDEYYAL